MNGFLIVLALAALPALGNLAGGLLAEVVEVSPRTLSLALHAAAGIVLAVVGVELLPEALTAERPWIVILAFVAGGGFFLLLDSALDLITARLGGEESASSWAIFSGVAIDLFTDGLMIGAGSAIDFRLALLVALGQVSADVPEGFATIANFKIRGVPRGRRMLLSLLFALPVLLGAMLGYLVLREQPDIWKQAILAFTAAILATLVVEEIMPEAHRGEEARLAALVFVGGFALFTLLSVYLGS